MPKILGFKGDLIKIFYTSFKNKSEFIEDDKIYICNVTMKEVGKGLTKSKLYHNASLQMTKVDWKKKLLEKGDRIEILDGAMWHPENVAIYTIRDKEKLKKCDKSQLSVDEKGYTVGNIYIYPYTLRCKTTQWKLISKFTNQNYCTIYGTRIKLPLENKIEFFNKKSLSWFLDKNEFDLLLQLHQKQVVVLDYGNKQLKTKKTMTVILKEDQTTNTYFLQLNEV